MRARNVKTYEKRRNISDVKYKELIRFDKHSVQYLATLFLTETQETRGSALSEIKRMEIFLRYLADPGFQNGVGEDFGIHRTTVTKTFNYVLNKVISKADHWIKFPTNINEVNLAKEKWMRKFKIPSVIGALDCTHIEIKKPRMYGDCYINRKGFPSINVQMTCDADEKITSVDASWPGSTHDSRIWRRSIISNEISKYNGTACLLADSGYGITPWILTPFKLPPRTQEQVAFNKQHSKERVTIERIFGQLKMRFPILANVCRVKLDKVPKVIVACVVLHNIGKEINDIIDVDVYPDEECETEDFHNDFDAADVDLRRRGYEKREEVMALLLDRL